MATKGKTKKSIPDYPSLFGELTEASICEPEKRTHRTQNKARRTPSSVRTYKGMVTEKESRQKRNMRNWSLLYPTPGKIKGSKLKF